MKYELSNVESAFPLVILSLGRGEEAKIENGSMVYHNGKVSIEGKMNSSGSGGIGGFLKAAARSAVSGESFFITTAKGLDDGAQIAIAPATVGQVRALEIGQKQWRINDGSFLACDKSVDYSMKMQSLGKAVFGGTGGLFVMETSGSGTMLICAFGDIVEIEVGSGMPFSIDNTHVIAWESSLQYEIKVASGMFGFTTGEGLVNEFRGVGKVLIQTRSLKGFADSLAKLIPGKS